MAFSCTSAFGQGKIKVVKPKQAPAPAVQSSEPDKVLYDRAMADLKKKRYIEERLSLETLINTYPDSEYLDKAKLAVADSYYTEGGVSNLTQAIGEYKSFVVFFPGDDKAPYAQMQIGMAHYKMMEKSDRDTSEALSAEAELQTFITKYPDDKLVPVAEQKLRDVQEVIADGEYKVARFYYLRPDYRASAARLVELTERYPLYSQSDQALWMLGDIYALMKNKGSRNEDDKNHWADLEGKVLDRIVTDYPLSPRAAQAKADLKAMGMPVPAADPAAVARMQKQEAFTKAHRQSAMKEPLALLKSGPDLSMAAQSGTPNLTPPADSITAKDILSPTTAGPSFNLAADSGAGAGGTDVSGVGASVTSVNDAAPDPAASNDPNAIISVPTTSNGDATPAASSDPVGQVDAPTTSSSDAPAAPASTATGNSAPLSATPTAPQNGTATAPATPGTESSSKNESSSKKKKGLSKLNPF
ncbi:MAG TPA: outer membrane protein assembly factor BamD [Candidatus Acidoferrales bacterium]